MPISDEDVDPAREGEEYEEVVEFQCPLCSTKVTEVDETCPGCGAIFVSSEDEDGADDDWPEASDDEVELDLSEDYELDEDVDYGNLDDEALEAEIAAMEADLGDDDYDDLDDVLLMEEPDELLDLDLGYEDELEAEEEVEEAFGTPVEVSAEDHHSLEHMAKPTLMERMFQRLGLGMFIAGGVTAVLIILWDPLQGNPLSLGVTQWRFLVLALAMFIAGFIVEMALSWSLSRHEEHLHPVEV